MPDRERLIALLFIAPALVLVILFVLWPVGYAMYTSLHDAPLTQRGVGTFVGSRNYDDLLADPTFRHSVRNTLYFTLMVVPAQTVLALLLAVWTNSRGLTKRGLRFAIFLPTCISLTVLSVVWKLMYEPATATGAGLINGLLIEAGLPSQPFLTSTAQAMPALVVMSVWQGVGLQMMIFLSTLQSISPQLYEAATIDGAGRVRRFLHVTLPAVTPTAAFVLMITTVFALKYFVQPYLMTDGGPNGATISLVQYVYEAAFQQRDLGLACAAGTLFFIGVCGVSGGLRWILHRAEAMV
jgi:ABC-type sugar transport system permease subunit